MTTPLQPAIDPTPQIARRRLLLGTLWGLPLALAGCGGGGGGGNSGDAGGTGDNGITLPAGSADGVPVTAQPVDVQLPDGLAAAAGRLWLSTATDTVELTGTRDSVRMPEGGAELVVLHTTDGTVLLIGWAGTGLAAPMALSAASSARVVLFQALLGFLLPPRAQASLRQALIEWPGADGIAAALAAALPGDLKALQAPATAVRDAVLQALADFEALGLPQAGATRRERPLGLTLDPTGDRSGIELLAGAPLNSIQFQNYYERRAVAFVNRIGYEKRNADGSLTFTESRLAGTAIEIAMPEAVDGVGSAIAAWAKEAYSGSGGTVGSIYRTMSEPQALEGPPDGQDRALYKVAVLMVGDMVGPDPGVWQGLTDDQKTYLEGINLKNIKIRYLLEDLLAPWVFNIIAQALGARLDKAAYLAMLKEGASALYDAVRSELGTELERVLSYQITTWDFFKAVLRRAVGDPATGKTTTFGRELVAAFIKLAASRFRNADGKLLLAGKDLDQVVGATMARMPALAWFAAADEVLKVGQTLRFITDVALSDGWQGWDVVVTQAKVRLTPESSTLEPTGKVDLVAEVVGDDDPDAVYVYEFTASGGPGLLIGYAANGKKVTQAEPRITYYADTTQATTPPETVTVVVTRGSLAHPKQLTLIGQATATVALKKPFSLFVTPDKAKLRPDGQITLLAGLKEAMPADTAVRYEWTTTGGTLAEPAPGTAQAGSGACKFTAPSSEGTVRINVTAFVTTPGAAIEQPTDPVEVVIEVDKTTKTISFRVFTDALVEERQNLDGSPYCNVAAVTWVPEVAGAISYRTTQTGCTDLYGCSYLERQWTPQSHFDIFQRGGMWYFGMGGDSGGCHDVAARVAFYKARFASAVVTCTVTLPN